MIGSRYLTDSARILTLSLGGLASRIVIRSAKATRLLTGSYGLISPLNGILQSQFLIYLLEDVLIGCVLVHVVLHLHSLGGSCIFGGVSKDALLVSRDQVSIGPSRHRLEALLGAEGGSCRFPIGRRISPLKNLLNFALVEQRFAVHGVGGEHGVVGLHGFGAHAGGDGRCVVLVAVGVRPTELPLLFPVQVFQTISKFGQF